MLGQCLSISCEGGLWQFTESIYSSGPYTSLVITAHLGVEASVLSIAPPSLTEEVGSNHLNIDDTMDAYPPPS